MTVAESLKRFRQEYHLSRKDIVERLKIPSATWYRYETGIVYPQADVILALAKEYGVSTDYLLGVSNSPQPYKVDAQFYEKVADVAKTLQSVLDNEADCLA